MSIRQDLEYQYWKRLMTEKVLELNSIELAWDSLDGKGSYSKIIGGNDDFAKEFASNLQEDFGYLIK